MSSHFNSAERRWEDDKLDNYLDEYDRNAELEEYLDKKVQERFDEEIQELCQRAVIEGGDARVSYVDGEIIVEIINNQNTII